ncbi:hypothetical protein UFOVP1229_164 [uncultured Caudovirales phage]|uniref:Uncharacterized protein n=1 Tax=uncultured Caudovirales phage TaxID=2100421 RepID=A0A6J5RBA7_9CAUD|nr:hypothetical protein UFOVP1229_164 [uncultured Caudovirales phage]
MIAPTSAELCEATDCEGTGFKVVVDEVAGVWRHGCGGKGNSRVDRRRDDLRGGDDGRCGLGRNVDPVPSFVNYPETPECSSMNRQPSTSHITNAAESSPYHPQA